MDLIYYGPLFRSAIPVKDQKGFVRANTKRGLGSINKHRGVGHAPSQTKNYLTFLLLLEFYREIPDILGKLADFESSISNSMTFPVFPGECTP